MHFNPPRQSTETPKPRARLNLTLRALQPLLFAIALGLFGAAAHAGACNVNTPGAATCAIPVGVTSVAVVATGGGGGGGGSGGSSGAGGHGGVVTQTLSGVGGTTLSLFVGGGGNSIPGGGGGGGGGASSVNAGTASQIIAGGGGGGGPFPLASGGGNGNGSAGGPAFSAVAGGGAGGVGGVGGGGGVASPGGNGNGGGGGIGGPNGGVSSPGGVGSGAGSGGNGFAGGAPGGGGGGGYGGGGGGASYAGGGGGGSTGGVVTVAANGGGADVSGGNGSIVITWIDPVVWVVTITTSPPAGGTVSCTPNPVLSGGASTCTATANPGYTFGAFSGDCTGASCVLSNVNSAKSVTASFTLNTYAVTAVASPLAGGTVSCTPNPVSYGSSSTCTATANSGYTFGVFSGDCTGASCVLSNVTSAKSVTASFTLNTYAVTAVASPLAGGTVSCTPNPVSYGSSSTCTATANPGYTFGAFSGDCTGASCVLSNVTAVKSVTASFTRNTYAVTALASPPAGGTVSCTPNPVSYGSSSTCTATAFAGYTFGTFSGDCTGASCVLSNVTSAKSVTASFAPLIPLLGNTLPGLSPGGPQLLNMAAGAGPDFMAGLVEILSNAVGRPLQFVEQNATGAVVLRGFNGGNLAFIPYGFLTGDNRAPGIYPVGNGQYQVVLRNGHQVTLAPALVRLDQLIALFAGSVTSQGDNGAITATLNGVTYAVQAGVAVQIDPASGIAQLVTGNDGLLHFIDALGNNQVLYPAFKEPGTLRNILQGLDRNATLSVQLDGTASILFNGQRYTLVPDLTLGSVPIERKGQNQWQDGPVRYRIVNVQVPFGTQSSQGFTVKQ